MHRSGVSSSHRKEETVLSLAADVVYKPQTKETHRL
jgi:hypothetical protein